APSRLPRNHQLYSDLRHEPTPDGPAAPHLHPQPTRTPTPPAGTKKGTGSDSRSLLAARDPVRGQWRRQRSSTAALDDRLLDLDERLDVRDRLGQVDVVGLGVGPRVVEEPERLLEDGERLARRCERLRLRDLPAAREQGEPAEVAGQADRLRRRVHLAYQLEVRQRAPLIALLELLVVGVAEHDGAGEVVGRRFELLPRDGLVERLLDARELPGAGE